MFDHQSHRGTIVVSALLVPVHGRSHSLPLRLVIGATVLLATVLAVASGLSVGAQSPYPPNTVVSTYADPRYCGGAVSVVTDSSGNLIDVCTTTGQRIYPVYPDNAYPTGYIAGNDVAPVAAPLVGTAPYGAPVSLPPAGAAPYIASAGGSSLPYSNGTYTSGAFFNGNFCNINIANCATLPAGGTQVGNVIYYTDNRFCGDGKLVDVLGQGYYCQNGGPLVTNGNVPTPTYSYPYANGGLPITNSYVPTLTYPNP